MRNKENRLKEEQGWSRYTSMTVQEFVNTFGLNVNKRLKLYIDRVRLKKHLLKTSSKITLRFYISPPQQCEEWKMSNFVSFCTDTLKFIQKNPILCPLIVFRAFVVTLNQNYRITLRMTSCE